MIADINRFSNSDFATEDDQEHEVRHTDGPSNVDYSRALLFTVGSELARAVCQSASKLADPRNSEFLGVRPKQVERVVPNALEPLEVKRFHPLQRRRISVQ